MAGTLADGRGSRQAQFVKDGTAKRRGKWSQARVSSRRASFETAGEQRGGGGTGSCNKVDDSKDRKKRNIEVEESRSEGRGEEPKTKREESQPALGLFSRTGGATPCRPANRCLFSVLLSSLGVCSACCFARCAIFIFYFIETVASTSLNLLFCLQFLHFITCTV